VFFEFLAPWSIELLPCAKAAKAKVWLAFEAQTPNPVGRLSDEILESLI
jgi:hypothetical protein